MTYRVGNKNPRNIYLVTERGEAHVGCMFDPADGPFVVTALNAHTPDIDYRAEAFEAVGLLGMVRQLRLDGEDDILTWARFDECWQDFHRRRQDDGPFRMPHETPDVDHTNGAREALAHVAERIADHVDRWGGLNLLAVRKAIEAVAAELGVDEDAPTRPATRLEDITQIVGDGGPGIRTYREVSASSATQAAERVHVEGIGYPEAPAPLGDRVRPIKPPRGRTDSDERADVQRRMVMLDLAPGWTGALLHAAEMNALRDELIAGRKAAELLDHLVDPDPCQLDHNGFCQAHYGTRDGRCDNDRAQELLAELNRRADQHGEECR